MRRVIHAAFRAADSLRQPELMKLALFCCALSLLAMGLFIGTVSGLTAWMIELQQAWLDWLAALLGGAGSVLIAWFLFPVTVPIIAGLFEDRVLRAVEKNAYPDLPEPPPQPFLPNLLEDVRFAGRVLLLNLLCLPFYFIPMVNVVLYYALNGYVFGSEFFAIAAGRHIGKKEARALRRRHAATVFGAGVLVAVTATLPVVNLFAPFLGMALMAHVYQTLK